MEKLTVQMGRTKSATYRNNAQNRLFSAKPIVMDWRKIKMKLCCRTTVPNVFLVQSYVMESQILLALSDKNCDEGEDEEGCSGRERCPQGTFQCATTKECLPEHHFCNSIADCKDLSDENEQKCKLEFHPFIHPEFCPFRCSNGLCRSSAIVCSGVNGCGDFSDEKAMSKTNDMTKKWKRVAPVNPSILGLSDPMPRLGIY
ncbi:Low-density lipoprotein receptor-related protein 2 [Folsomia candida]|uniref:Low-density lipoprotein receptor-related protein 2 n=1 Tax=Folsomia candida TaxID=158441 RepID=A0A226F2N5_FOLCA|nr:Low-density lipoprotein receptor-related protein 2 [Folsomia candida]